MEKAIGTPLRRPAGVSPLASRRAADRRAVDTDALRTHAQRIETHSDVTRVFLVFGRRSRPAAYVGRSFLQRPAVRTGTSLTMLQDAHRRRWAKVCDRRASLRRSSAAKRPRPPRVRPVRGGVAGTGCRRRAERRHSVADLEVAITVPALGRIERAVAPAARAA